MERRSCDFAVNFAGFHARRNCYAFKGEMRLLRHFLDCLGGLFRRGRVEATLAGPAYLHVPLLGLNDGLGRREFEDKVKIGTCVVFLAARPPPPRGRRDHAAGNGWRTPHPPSDSP